MTDDRLTELEAVLRSGSINDQRLALDELALRPASEAIPLLERLLQAKSFGTRRLAMMGLGNHRTEASFNLLKQVLATEVDPNVVAEAADTLFDFGELALPLLKDLFERNDHWLVRQTIIAVLMECDREDILLSVAVTALADPVQTVKESGILALGKLLKGPLQDQAFPYLAKLAEDNQWRNRWRTATALRMGTTPAAKDLLVQLQRDPNHRVVAEALEGSVSE